MALSFVVLRLANRLARERLYRRIVAIDEGRGVHVIRLVHWRLPICEKLTRPLV